MQVPEGRRPSHPRPGPLDGPGKAESELAAVAGCSVSIELDGDTLAVRGLPSTLIALRPARRSQAGPSLLVDHRN
jgi:hypothetical protein